VGGAIELRKAVGTGCRLHSERRKATRQPRYTRVDCSVLRSLRTRARDKQHAREPGELLDVLAPTARPVREAINRTADVNVQEQSDCVVLPMNQPNKEGQPSAEVGEGGADRGERRAAPRGRSPDSSPDPEMAEGGSIGRRPVVGDEEANPPDGNALQARLSRRNRLSIRTVPRAQR
jgi:hypothetical protein